MRRVGLVLCLVVAGIGVRPLAADERPAKRVAAIVTEFRQNSHAEMIVGRMLQTLTLDGQGARPALKVVSLFTDQVPQGDTSRALSKEFGFPIYDTIREALTLGGTGLAVDGVVVVAEHGKYPESETGNTVYPKRRFFEEIARVFRESGRSVPVFSDKHLADNWQDARWIYDTSRELKFSLMSGSSLPTAWRVPAVDLDPGAKLKEIVVISYGSLDAYGFHALEMMQCLAERRAGGETGVRAIQCLTGEAVWKGATDGTYDVELLNAALSRQEWRRIEATENWRAKVREPVLFVIDYTDGLRGCLFSLNGVVGNFCAGWRYVDGRHESTLFRLDEDRPFMHFAHQVNGIEQLMHDGKAPWPAERTLLTSGILDASLISKKKGNVKLETPWLDVRYATDWTWKMPPPR